MAADTTSTRVADQFHEGLVLNGRYTVLNTLNQGSYGVVVLARDSNTESHVAIKCLEKVHSEPPDDECPFFRQELHFHTLLAEHASNCPGSDNIVRCIDSFETPQNAFLVLEYCDLGDLYENIMQGRIPRDTQTVKEMMLQLVAAVKYCHDAGVYHRDIKPENILMTVSSDGFGKPLLKLGDFGLATHDEWTADIGTGSDRYMAPEQYEAVHEGYSPAKADIWALGCCLLNLVFSRNPFKVPSTSDPIFADYVRDPMSLCDVFPTMSTDTFEVLKHALAVDPEKRDLDKLHQALLNVVNWTDSETVDDEYENVQTDFTCYADEPITCTVFNRAPLRTPSFAQSQPFFSTPVDGTPFSWASALQRPVDKISKIEESEDEDIEDYFSDMESNIKGADDGRSSDSGLGTSLGSLSVATRVTTGKVPHNFASSFLPAPPDSTKKSIESRARPIQASTRKVPDVAKTSSSVPISSSRGILGKYVQGSGFSDKLKFGKSWSDWVEEEEDEQLSRGNSRASSGSSSMSSFDENAEDNSWWEEGLPSAQRWED